MGKYQVKYKFLKTLVQKLIRVTKIKKTIEMFTNSIFDPIVVLRVFI